VESYCAAWATDSEAALHTLQNMQTKQKKKNGDPFVPFAPGRGETERGEGSCCFGAVSIHVVSPSIQYLCNCSFSACNCHSRLAVTYINEEGNR
jgi:hypothetical protein